MNKNFVLSLASALFACCLLIILAGFSKPEEKKIKTAGGGLLSFTIRTVTQNGTYAPKNVFVIWIEDVNGFVKTSKAMANQRKQYLYTWKAASNYNVVDAITGPTLTNHQTHTVTWDCTDLNGNIVPDGDYIVRVEFTEKHAQGPLYSLSFTKGPDAQSITPADETYFKDIHLEFEPYLADFTSDVNEICQGDTITFTDLSVGATSWSWIFGEGASPASAVTSGPHLVTYLSSGPKTISLTINNLVTEIKQNMITVNPSPTADFSFSGNLYTVEFSNNSVDATSFFWDFGDGNTSTDNNPFHTYAVAGSYDVSLTAYYIGCNDIIFHEVSVPLVGISKKIPERLKAVSVFPNPTSGLINIKFNKPVSGVAFLNIYNAFGKEIHVKSVNGIPENGIISLDLSGQAKGIYFLKVSGCELETDQIIILD